MKKGEFGEFEARNRLRRIKVMGIQKKRERIKEKKKKEDK